MNANQLRKFSYAMHRAYQKLTPAAKKDPELAAIAEAAQKLWLASGTLADQKLLKLGERKDKGEVLWTVFRPIILGRGEKAYSGGVTEMVRTPNRTSLQYFWHSERAADRKPAKWTPERPAWADLDFRRAMNLEEGMGFKTKAA